VAAMDKKDGKSGIKNITKKTIRGKHKLNTLLILNTSC
jgi:hypothetical protein